MHDPHASTSNLSTEKHFHHAEHEISEDHQEATHGERTFNRHLSLIVEADVEANAELEKALSRVKSKDPNLV